MATATFQRLQAGREGLSTYSPLPAVLGCGALAAFMVIMLPFWLRLCTSSVGFFDRWVSYRSLKLAEITFRQGMAMVGLYIETVWPYIILVTVLGFYLAWLRRTRGMQYREIPWRPYENRVRLPLRPHRLITYIAGPVVLMCMAWSADRQVYPIILRDNFAFWLSSGVAALVLWEALTDLLLGAGILLHLWAKPARRLDLELELKGVLTADADLGEERWLDIIVHADGSARLVADLPLPKQRRALEVARTLTTISAVEIVAPAVIAAAPEVSGAVQM